MLAGYVTGAILRFVFDVSRGISYFDWILFILYYFIAFTSAFIISIKFGNFFANKLRMLDCVQKNRLATYLIFGGVITLALFFTRAFLTHILADATLLNAIYATALFSYFIYLVFVVFTFTDSLCMEVEINKKDEMLKNLQAYTKSVESMATEVRKFRHDNLNLMLGFQEHVKNKDIDKIDMYFNEYMTVFQKDVSVMNLQLDVLNRLKIPEVKSILSFKVLGAQQSGIDVHIEVTSEIEGVDNYNLVDICRIVGVLADNAIEACEGLDGPVWRFFAQRKNSSVLFVFANSCPSAPPFSKISKEGFTTKSGARGLGLYVVSGILEENQNLSLNTLWENGYFIQELRISTS